MMTEAVKEFLCYRCNLKIKYDYYGKKPPFAKSIAIGEECYVIKDPFTSDVGIINLGSHCSVCQRSVCASGDCSIFYCKRFCLQCVQENIEEFPIEIRQEIKDKSLRQTNR
ncbi:Cysteine-rich DPF motif domain-containing protein 1 [Mactra antiquata]